MLGSLNSGLMAAHGKKLNKNKVITTHQLKCRHCVGPNCLTYRMPCTILKDMGDGRVKVLVIGERYWKDKENIQRIRYVEKSRVTPIPKAASDDSSKADET